MRIRCTRGPAQGDAFEATFDPRGAIVIEGDPYTPTDAEFLAYYDQVFASFRHPTAQTDVAPSSDGTWGNLPAWGDSPRERSRGPGVRTSAFSAVPARGASSAEPARTPNGSRVELSSRPR